MHATPAPDGELIASIPRRLARGGESELRVVLHRHDVGPYVGLSTWDLRGDGWHKVRSLAVRIDEAEALAAALIAAVRREAERPVMNAKHLPRRRRMEPTGEPLPPARAGFDEIG